MDSESTLPWPTVLMTLAFTEDQEMEQGSHWDQTSSCLERFGSGTTVQWQSACPAHFRFLGSTPSIKRTKKEIWGKGGGRSEGVKE